MKTVALFGKGWSGKTTTINIFIKKVLSLYKDRIVVKKTSYVGNSISDYLDETINPNGDNRYIVVDIDGHTIGITTVGDARWCLEEDFRYFDDCEFCFCAARSGGNTHTYLEEICNGDVLIYYRQTQVYGFNVEDKKRQELANDSMSELLLKEFNSILNGKPYTFS